MADACHALETRQSLGDYWLILLQLVEQGLRGTNLNDALRKELDKNKSLRRKFNEDDPESPTYADKIAEYLKILPPDESEPVSLTRQYVIGKDPPDGEDEAALFELRQGKIVPIYGGRMATETPNQSAVAVRLYKARLLVPFIKSLDIPDNLKELVIDIIPTRVRNRNLDLIGETLEPHLTQEDFEREAEAFLKRAMKERGANPGKGARAANEIKRERKTAELKEACRKSGLSPEAYKRAKQTVKQLKGSNDWLPKLGQDDIRALDLMMNDWRSSGMDYFAWSGEERKKRHREASVRRESWHMRHNENSEDKAARRKAKDAERKRLTRAAAAEKSEIDVVSTTTLTPEPVPGHKQDFKVGMAVVRWKDGDAKDAEPRVLPPQLAAELAASTLGLSPKERARLESSKRSNEQAAKVEGEIRISMLDANLLANLDYLSDAENKKR